MIKTPFYISFGQTHVHRVNGITFDCDCLCRIYADHMVEARSIAFDAFGDKWGTSYTEPDMRYFPRGAIDLKKGEE